MPQTAPMNWLLLFIMFSTIFMWINSINFFLFLYKNKIKKNYNLKKINYWKW